ncbi:DUF418 domain-containing protein [Sphingomonas sp.]|uniref:DUF418 domain-containing protein n=1 Tax=Sphingomonas sp. TaxID=28214 RepID=UPI001B204C14|nr:DUF418 domain-containing protein [Sphingomonas sp.]MBO9712904.1 DUF418 domain-containing protein [Sphingomonas sp.]
MNDNESTVSLAPVSGKARIDVLDVMRGLAILGIFFMNSPFMGFSIPSQFMDVRIFGWTPADAASWFAVQVMLEGTQRGLLELLFGAGLMVFAARAMAPDGPVAVADLYWRRNLWLLFFGLFDIFVLLWPGDILHIYALAALFLFPFRKLGPKLLLALGMANLLVVAGVGAFQYQERVEARAKMETAWAHSQAHKPLSDADRKALEEWKKIVDNRYGHSEEIRQLRAAEKPAHAGGFLAYAQFEIGAWIMFIYPSLPLSILEAFCMMLIGIAFWKWQIIQGGRSARFYWALMLAGYAVAIPLRWIAADQTLTMDPVPKIGWITYEIGRMAMTFGHVGLINLAMRSGAGRLVLAPFKAAGRTAFSLYFLQQIVGIYILFAPWGPGLWNKLSWGGLYSVALGVIAAEVVLANLWLLVFRMGPLEWLWRSLAYVQRQPLLKRANVT